MKKSTYLANAQDTVWSKALEKVFGTRAENVHQDLISRQSESGYLSSFIGFKQYYAQNLSGFLQAEMEYSYDDSPNVPGHDVTVLSRNGVYMGAKPPKVRIIFLLNKDNRIVSGTVKGPFLTLAELFLDYWPQDPVWATVENLKPGTAAVKHCYGDLISFKWINGLPLIVIAKDPNWSFPVPPRASISN